MKTLTEAHERAVNRRIARLQNRYDENDAEHPYQPTRNKAQALELFEEHRWCLEYWGEGDNGRWVVMQHNFAQVHSEHKSICMAICNAYLQYNGINSKTLGSIEKEKIKEFREFRSPLRKLHRKFYRSKSVGGCYVLH